MIVVSFGVCEKNKYSVDNSAVGRDTVHSRPGASNKYSVDPHALTRHHPGICCHAYRIVQSSVHLSPIADGGLFFVLIDDATFHRADSSLGFVRMRSLRDGTFVLRRSCTFKSTRARVLVHGWYVGSARVRGRGRHLETVRVRVVSFGRSEGVRECE